MKEPVKIGDATLICADVIEGLRSLPADSVQCVVTSPPYWGLRDYGVPGMIGLEPTLQEWIDRLVAVCDEVKRVLRPDGTFWLNCGDAYAGSGQSGLNIKGETSTLKGSANIAHSCHTKTIPQGFKPKDLLMMPARLAIALQGAGWWLRSEIIWAKPNPMPESVTDRPTSSHEKIYLLTKSSRYFYDADAVREKFITGEGNKMPDGWDTGIGGHGTIHREGRERGKLRDKASEGWVENATGNNCQSGARDWYSKLGRNLRNVWTIATQPYPEAHFATFPEALPMKCIMAGSKEGDTILDPFSGSATTGLVALKLRRRYIGIELNPEYIELSRRRIQKEASQGKLFNQ